MLLHKTFWGTGYLLLALFTFHLNPAAAILHKTEKASDAPIINWIKGFFIAPEKNSDNKEYTKGGTPPSSPAAHVKGPPPGKYIQHKQENIPLPKINPPVEAQKVSAGWVGVNGDSVSISEAGSGESAPTDRGASASRSPSPRESISSRASSPAASLSSRDSSPTNQKLPFHLTDTDKEMWRKHLDKPNTHRNIDILKLRRNFANELYENPVKKGRPIKTGQVPRPPSPSGQVIPVGTQQEIASIRDRNPFEILRDQTPAKERQPLSDSWPKRQASLVRPESRSKPLVRSLPNSSGQTEETNLPGQASRSPSNRAQASSQKSKLRQSKTLVSLKERTPKRIVHFGTENEPVTLRDKQPSQMRPMKTSLRSPSWIPNLKPDNTPSSTTSSTSQTIQTPNKPNSFRISSSSGSSSPSHSSPISSSSSSTSTPYSAGSHDTSASNSPGSNLSHKAIRTPPRQIPPKYVPSLAPIPAKETVLVPIRQAATFATSVAKIGTTLLAVLKSLVFLVIF